jgi:hypothetical protein
MLAQIHRPALAAGALVAFAASALLLARPSTGFAAAPALTGGDKSATVTVEGRPLSADTDHVIAFTRGKILYVSVRALRRMVSGSVSHDGKVYTVNSFRGDSNSKSYTFTIGSPMVTAAGTTVKLEAPVIKAYGHIYIPLSFFGSGAVRTKVKISADDRTGDIILPPGMM